MKILFESQPEQTEPIEDAADETSTPKRNIANVFNIPLIQNELKQVYGVETSISSKRKWSDDIWYVTVTSPYIGKSNSLLSPSKSTTVALFVDYASNSAFAMPRGGADKQSMMLIASVANKHINKPFECNASIRYNLHSKGGDE